MAGRSKNKNGAGPRASVVPIDTETVNRVRALCQGNGLKQARSILGVSTLVLDEFRSNGLVTKDALERVQKKLTELGA